MFIPVLLFGIKTLMNWEVLVCYSKVETRLIYFHESEIFLGMTLHLNIEICFGAVMRVFHVLT